MKEKEEEEPHIGGRRAILRKKRSHTFAHMATKCNYSFHTVPEKRLTVGPKNLLMKNRTYRG